MTDVEATQLRDSIRAGYESFCMDRLRACGNNWALPPQSLSINSVGYDPRREVAQKSLSLDLLRDASKLCRLPIESGPLWRGRRMSANLAMSDHLSRASWIDRYRGSKHPMSLARLV